MNYKIVIIDDSDKDVSYNPLKNIKSVSPAAPSSSDSEILSLPLTSSKSIHDVGELHDNSLSK